MANVGYSVSIHVEWTEKTLVDYIGVGTGPADPVLAGPLFQGKNIISFLQKTSNKQKC